MLGYLWIVRYLQYLISLKELQLIIFSLDSLLYIGINGTRFSIKNKEITS